MQPRLVTSFTLDELMSHPLPQENLAAEINGALRVAGRARAGASQRLPGELSAYGGAMFAFILISAAALRSTRADHPRLKPVRHKALGLLAHPHERRPATMLALQVLEAALTAQAHLGSAPRALDPDAPGYLRQEHDPKPWLQLASVAVASGLAHRDTGWHVMLP